MKLYQGDSRNQNCLKKKDDERLESIKAAHKSVRTGSSTREEDYLEIISELVELKGYATTLDISRYMNVSAPSVTKMLQRLDEDGFLAYIYEGGDREIFIQSPRNTDYILCVTYTLLFWGTEQQPN